MPTTTMSIYGDKTSQPAKVDTRTQVIIMHLCTFRVTLNEINLTLRVQDSLTHLSTSLRLVYENLDSSSVCILSTVRGTAARAASPSCTEITVNVVMVSKAQSSRRTEQWWKEGEKLFFADIPL